MTPQQIEAMKQALEALEYALNKPMWNRPKMTVAITALEEALAQPEQEPVACKHEWFRTGAMEPGQCRCIKCGAWNTTPPQRKPLTDEELRVIENKINPNMRWRSSDEEGITLYPIEYYELVRAIEAAHGIKE